MKLDVSCLALLLEDKSWFFADFAANLNVYVKRGAVSFLAENSGNIGLRIVPHLVIDDLGTRFLTHLRPILWRNHSLSQRWKSAERRNRFLVFDVHECGTRAELLLGVVLQKAAIVIRSRALLVKEAIRNKQWLWLDNRMSLLPDDFVWILHKKYL